MKKDSISPSLKGLTVPALSSLVSGIPHDPEVFEPSSILFGGGVAGTYGSDLTRNGKTRPEAQAHELDVREVQGVRVQGMCGHFARNWNPWHRCTEWSGVQVPTRNTRIIGIACILGGVIVLCLSLNALI